MSNDAPMMACGHAASGLQGTGTDARPVCVVCSMLGDPKAATVDTDPPDLTGRTARCAYYGHAATGRQREGPCNGTWSTRDEPCRCEQPSTDGISSDGPARLAFFEHRPDQDHDRYYCGCWGWD